MMEQVQKEHNHNARTVSPEEQTAMQEEAADSQKAKVAHEAGKVIDAELEAVLDSIDEVLEENAQEFVNTYIQKGGE